MEELIDSQFPYLETPLQDLLQSNVLYELIDEIVDEHPLQEVQKNAFAREVLLVLLRVQSVEMFTHNIKQGMEIAMKRADAIASKTKRLIFLSVNDYLIQRQSEVEGAENGVASDGVIPKTKSSVPEVPQKGMGRIDHEIPLRDVEFPIKDKIVEEQRPIVAPVPEEVVPTAKEKVLSSPPVPQKEASDSLDIFKKRLEEPVHTPVEENQIGDTVKRIPEVDPDVKKAIESDPYKESI